MKKIYLSLLMAASAIGAYAQGGLSAEQIERLKADFTTMPAVTARQNALSGTDIATAARTTTARAGVDDNMTYRVSSRGITDQKRSGRCWLFTGLNVLRAQAMTEHDMGTLTLSQNYNFFYDQLEKANLFLQAIIDTAGLPADDRTVDWLFSNPISDGGQFTGLTDNLSKYGVVPSSVMPETYSSENTARMRSILASTLRADGLKLRKMAAEGANAQQLESEKLSMLGTVYGILGLCLGTPPDHFEWTGRDADGKSTIHFSGTPQQFYAKYFGNDLDGDYVMIMNDPTRDYYKVYEIEYDRHSYDGHNWRYLNLPMDEIATAAIASIKDDKAMYFSCDVNKLFDRETGSLDLRNYDYASLFDLPEGMDKRSRILSHDSASTHAMTLVGVDVDESGKPVKWLIENSWGNGANGGHLVATNDWMNEYLFRLVVDRRYLPAKTLRLLDQPSVKLPAWDFMF